MTQFYSASSVSPITAILWCLYPIAALVIVELLLGGGFDDDNDDQDGGMLIPAYSRSDVWNFFILNYNFWINTCDKLYIMFKWFFFNWNIFIINFAFNNFIVKDIN